MTVMAPSGHQQPLSDNLPDPLTHWYHDDDDDEDDGGDGGDDEDDDWI